MEEIKKDLTDKCLYYFQNGYSCSESTLKAGMEYLRLTESCTPAIASAFGGGIKSRGHICGGISATLMLIGIMHGKQQPNDSTLRLDELANQFLAYCDQHLGTLMCSDICGIDFKTEPYPSEKASKIIKEKCHPALSLICQWQKENLA